MLVRDAGDPDMHFRGALPLEVGDIDPPSASANLLARALPLQRALGQLGADPLAIGLKCQTAGVSSDMHQCNMHVTNGAVV